MKQIFLFILILFVQINWAQQIIGDIDADYIMVDKGELIFLKKNKGNIQYKTEIRFYPSDEAIGKKIETRRIEASDYNLKRFNEILKDPNEYSYIIKVSKIEKQEPEELINFLQNQKMIHQKSETGNYTLEFYNKAFFISANYYKEPTNDKTIKWRRFDEDLIPFIIVDINNRKPIIIFPYIKHNSTYSEQHRSDTKYLINYLGFIIPQKRESLIVRYKEILTHLNLPINSDFLEEYTHIEDKSPQWSHQYQFKDSYVKDVIFGQALLDEQFDAVSISNGFIIGRRGATVKVFNLGLKEITPKDLNSAFSIDDYTEYAVCLIGDQIKYLSKTGEVLDELPMRVINAICGFYNPDALVYYSLEDNDTHYFLKSTYTYEDFDEKEKTLVTEIPLFDKKDFDSVYFLDPSARSMKKYIKEHYEYLIAEKNGKKGMFAVHFQNVNYPQNLRSTHEIELEELLPVKFDDIKKEYGTPHVLFSKDGLYGIYGLNEAPKYEKIEVSYYFSRFELPDGRKGWLDKLGNEFMDE